MGLPIAQLICATNENNVLDEFFRTGTYRVRSSAQTFHTSSPSMDISKASNFERFVYDLVDQDPKQLAALWQQVERDGGFTLDATLMQRVREEFGFASGSSSHSDRLNTIRDIQQRYGIVIDPHTADGIKVARQYLQPGVPMVVLETALPAKFTETIEEALGAPAPRPAGFEQLETLPQRFEVMPAQVDAVKQFIRNATQIS